MDVLKPRYNMLNYIGFPALAVERAVVFSETMSTVVERGLKAHMGVR